MPLKQDRLERSLKIAQNALGTYEQKLDERKVDPTLRKKDHRWRELGATCRTIESRLESLADLNSRGKKGESDSEEE